MGTKDDGNTHGHMEPWEEDSHSMNFIEQQRMFHPTILHINAWNMELYAKKGIEGELECKASKSNRPISSGFWRDSLLALE